MRVAMFTPHTAREHLGQPTAVKAESFSWEKFGTRDLSRPHHWQQHAREPALAMAGKFAQT